ncbi:MAG: circadian clock protein KaiC [Desulfovibrionales bacterium]
MSQFGHVLEKTPSGIAGLDDVTGGMPRNRIILIAGGPGTGKTLFGTHFIVSGALEFDEPGVFVSFEESEEEIAQNVASLGWDLHELTRQQKIIVDNVRLNRDEILETGAFDLEGLFIRMQHAIDSIGAKRVVLDTVEYLFSGLPNELILRSELKRLFRWLKEKGVTTIVTGEKGTGGGITRFGLEEYVSDCVIELDHRITEEVSTRRIRVVKYRGSVHGTNEYPFLITEHGLSVLPITSAGLDYEVSSEFVTTGIPQLDTLLDGKGFFKGSSVLLTGTAGSGKSSFAAHFANATCQQGKKCLYFAFEESTAQITRNMRSIGVDLEACRKRGLLQIHASRPTEYGLEQHLTFMFDRVEKEKPSFIIIDPISSFDVAGSSGQVKSLLTRFVDYLKNRAITSVFTELIPEQGELYHSRAVVVSSLMDTWILLRNQEKERRRRKTISIIKARGMNHSPEIFEFHLSLQGVDITGVEK